MQILRIGAFALGAALVGAVCTAYAADSADSLTVKMKALNDSGENGTAAIVSS